MRQENLSEELDEVFRRVCELGAANRTRNRFFLQDDKPDYPENPDFGPPRANSR